MKKKLASLLFPALLIGGGAFAQTPGPHSGEPATIPFVQFGSINDWRADGDKGIFIQDQHRNWYYATLMGPCTELPFAEAIGIKTWGMDTLDGFSTILVRHQQCQISKLVHSGPPPAKAKAKHS